MNSVINEVGITLISYKSGNKLYDCLKKIKKLKNIYVLDNNQDYLLKKKIKKEFPNVKFFISKKNLGFSRGHNFLLNKVKTKYCLILSPDLQITLSKITKLFKIAKKLKDQFFFISPKNQYIQNSAFYKKNNTKNSQGLLEKKIIEIDKMYFFAPLINIKNFKKLNFFDENIFMYFEDLDACLRIKKNKGKMYLANQVEVKHLSGKSSDEKNYDKIRNFHWGWSYSYFNKKHKNYLHFKLIIIFTIIKLKLKIVYYLLLKKSPQEAKKIQFILKGIERGEYEKKDFYRSNYEI